MVNMDPLDRGARALVGLAFLASPVLDFATAPYNLLGLIPLVTGIAGFCPVYRLFGFSTCRAGSYAHGRPMAKETASAPPQVGRRIEQT